jgi:protoporphyrinogen oxidase
VVIKTSCAVKRIENNDDSKPVLYFENGSHEQFDEVIVTLPSGIAVNLCSGLQEIEIQKLKNVEYLGVICVAVLLDKSISPFYVTNITDSSVPFTGVIEMSALVDKKYFNNYSLVYLPKYVNPEDHLFNQSDKEIKDYFLTNLKKMYPQLADNNIKFAGVARLQN